MPVPGVMNRYPSGRNPWQNSFPQLLQFLDFCLPREELQIANTRKYLLTVRQISYAVFLIFTVLLHREPAGTEEYIRGLVWGKTCSQPEFQGKIRWDLPSPMYISSGQVPVPISPFSKQAELIDPLLRLSCLLFPGPAKLFGLSFASWARSPGEV